jgi:hypothetical protein
MTNVLKCHMTLRRDGDLTLSIVLDVLYTIACSSSIELSIIELYQPVYPTADPSDGRQYEVCLAVHVLYIHI